MCVNAYLCVNAYVCANACLCANVYVFVRMHVCVHVHVYACVCECTQLVFFLLGRFSCFVYSGLFVSYLSYLILLLFLRCLFVFLEDTERVWILMEKEV